MRKALWLFLRWFLFRVDAETAHLFTLFMIRLGIKMGNAPLRIASGSPSVPPSKGAVSVFGLDFASRVGLAAGFDKNAEILRGLPALGFGFAEIGTVTPRPQPGNERPRLFRDPAKGAIFNRMGFNNLGAEIVSRRLAKARERIPGWFRVGVNIGKNKDTPLESAAEDYAKAAKAFQGIADYLVINVSSPNTPGLRSLQAPQALEPIVAAVREAVAGWSKRPPILLKLAPELGGRDLSGLLAEGERWGVDGWVLTNTLQGRWQRSGGEIEGGWSGAPLTELSRSRLREAHEATKLPVISVGGVMDVEEAKRRIAAGAALVQVYSGWILGGPGFPAEIARGLVES